jgi:hypothetical protein
MLVPRRCERKLRKILPLPSPWVFQREDFETSVCTSRVILAPIGRAAHCCADGRGDEALKRVYAPIGLDLGGTSPLASA